MKAYTDYIRLWSPVALAAAMIVCAGCSDDIAYMNGDIYDRYPSECLAFTTHLAPESRTAGSRSTVANLEIVEVQWPLKVSGDSVASRATLANHLSGEAGIIGFQYEDKSDADGDGLTDKFTGISSVSENLKFTFDDDRLVSKGFTVPWSTISKAHLNVYAYAPWMPTSNNLTLDLAAETPEIIYEYTVPGDIDKQKDILVASRVDMTSGKDYRKTIPLVFDHALTAICFRVGFETRIKSVAINNVHNHGFYDFLKNKWTDVGVSTEAPCEYMLTFDETYVFSKNELLTHTDEYMILMPQTLPEDANIVLTCVKDNTETAGGTEPAAGAEYITYTANIGGQVWSPGKLITYTFYKDAPPETIYLDLALGDVSITADAEGKGTYSGTIYRNGQNETISKEYNNDKQYHFYVYQSTEANREGIWTGDVCTPPEYDRVKGPDGRPWTEFITNNTNVEAVIGAWSKTVEGLCNDRVATAVGRSGTENKISISGNVTCDLTIDNIYSTYQDPSPVGRTTAGISFLPAQTVNNAKVTVNIVGDNRIGAVHYYNTKEGNEIIFEGTGSLTVADVNGQIRAGTNNLDDEVGLNAGESGYWYNHWSSAIGGCDNNRTEVSNGIVINSGIIFAGTTKAENCTAIGGGGNSYGKVIINGGTVTAVASTTGTAIGGGIGFNGGGGMGTVEINGGNVYAYNFANRWNIPSSAIGGAGSRRSAGNTGNVTITGGYVYAESELGTAIGGGSSYLLYGGNANITITGGEVFAKTRSPISASIGGGTAFTQGQGRNMESSENNNGGNATVTIYGTPIIRTGSIGGGGTGDKKAKIGNATISISGGDIQAQCILAAGSVGNPEFTMTGGTIRNSNTSDTEYMNVKPDGGAVYLEDGKVSISGGTIKNCKAARGGAIYIKGTSESGATFTMTGGKIENNEAVRDNGTGYGDSADDFAGSGGAVYIVDGTVDLEGGAIANNLAAGGHGGGVFIRRGHLTIGSAAGTGGPTIDGNSSEVRRTETGTYAGGDGGGVYVYSKISDVNVSLNAGMIANNTADRRGGGLCVIQDSDDGHAATITIGTENGTDDGLRIIHNHSLLQGGGLYASGKNASITINSGTIDSNTVSQYVHNENVANEKGSVTLNGGVVKHQVVTFNANDGTANPETSTQKIVTETNSLLKAPVFDRLGYRLAGWNTKPSGSGTSYADGAVMNIKEDMTLYAQWQML